MHTHSDTYGGGLFKFAIKTSYNFPGVSPGLITRAHSGKLYEVLIEVVLSDLEQLIYLG
jgi:hypothetical protein